MSGSAKPFFLCWRLVTCPVMDGGHVGTGEALAVTLADKITKRTSEGTLSLWTNHNKSCVCSMFLHRWPLEDMISAPSVTLLRGESLPAFHVLALIGPLDISVLS